MHMLDLEKRVIKVGDDLPNNAIALRKIMRTLAHDFNNTLAILNTHIELMQEDLEQGSLGYSLSLKALKAIEDAAEKTASILSVPISIAGKVDIRAFEEELNDKKWGRGDVKPLRILLVEGDRDNRDNSHQVLKRMGHNTIAADTAQAALDILSIDQNFDVLISDVMLVGGMSGVALARSAKSIAPAVRILFMSDYTRDATGMKIDNVAGARMISKPFIPLELNHALHDLMAA